MLCFSCGRGLLLDRPTEAGLSTAVHSVRLHVAVQHNLHRILFDLNLEVGHEP